MTGKFINLNRRNGGCPVCNSSDGRCRQTEDERGELFLCMESQGDVSGFHYLGQAHGGMWGQYKPNNGERREWRRDYEPAPKPEGVKLPAKERDAAIKSILQQLPLEECDRKDLIRRGLTPKQINDWGFYSLSKDSVLENPVNADLAGMAIDGRHVCMSPHDAGYSIPIKNIDGLFVGEQIRVRKPIGFQPGGGKDAGGKYKWKKSNKNQRRERDAVSHTAEFEELPLQHAIVNPTQGQPLCLTEGTGKPVFTSFKFNLNVIGASGGNFLSSKKTLKNSLDILKPSEIILGADSGSRINKNVLRQYRRLAKQLKEWGYDLLVADWGQGSDKSKPDIDELDAHIWELKHYQDWDVAYRIPANQLDVDGSSEDWREKRIYASHLAWKNNKRYTPDHTFDESYCTSPPAPRKGEGVAIKYHTSQGKSTWIKSKFKNELKDLGAIKLGYRNSLEIQFAAGSNFYHLREDDGIQFIKDPRSRLTLCIDSILKFADEDFDDKVLVFDEIESKLRHLLYGGTVKERLQEIINKLTVALQRCHSYILSDGGLTDATCDYLQKLSGKPLTKYYNKRLPIRPVCYFYQDVNTNFKKIMHQIKGEKFPWLMFDSQVDCEAADKDLRTYGRKPLRIDSKTINDLRQGAIIKQFLANPDEFLEENEKNQAFDCIISSPSIESGLDCNYKGFSGVYLLAKHLEINSLTQMLIRVRDVSVPRHICCAKFVKQSDDDTTIRSPFQKNLDRMLYDSRKQSIEALGDELWKNKAEIVEALHRFIDENIYSPEEELFSVLQAIKNYEQANLQDCLVESLQNSGYEIKLTTIQKPTLTTFKEAKKEVKKRIAKDITHARKLDEDDYKKISKRQDLKWEDRCAVTKYHLLERLPGIEAVGGWTEEFVYHLLFENKKLIHQAEIRWMLNHPELAVKRSEKSWFNVLRFKRTFLGNFKTLLPLIKELNRLEVPELLNKLTRIYYNSNSSEVRELWKNWGRTQVARTGIERGASPAILINRIAAKLGYESVEIAIGKVNGKTQKDYILNDLLEDCYGVIVAGCVDERLSNENLAPRLTDDDWLQILQPQSLETIQEASSSGYKLDSNTIYTNKEVCNRQNVYVEPVPSVTDVKNQLEPEPTPEPKPETPTTPEPETQPEPIKKQPEPETLPDLPKVGQKIECWTHTGVWKIKIIKKVVGGKMPNVQFSDGSFCWLEELSDRSRFNLAILTDFSQSNAMRPGLTG